MRYVTTFYVFTHFDSKIFRNSSNHFHVACASTHSSIQRHMKHSMKYKITRVHTSMIFPAPYKLTKRWCLR